VPQSIQEITALVTRAHDRGRAPLVVVSEGFTLTGMDEAFSDKGLDAFNRPRLGGISEVLAPEIERLTGIETRSTVLGHIQRGGSPSAFDRVLATRLGLHVADAVVDGAWGQMVALRGIDIVRVPFAEALPFTLLLALWFASLGRGMWPLVLVLLALAIEAPGRLGEIARGEQRGRVAKRVVPTVGKLLVAGAMLRVIL
jgi:hypothetical protein